MEYVLSIWYIDMVIYDIDMVIRDIDMGYGPMIWEMTVSIRSSPISIWDILSLCLQATVAYLEGGRGKAEVALLHDWEVFDGLLVSALI